MTTDDTLSKAIRLASKRNKKLAKALEEHREWVFSLEAKICRHARVEKELGIDIDTLYKAMKEGVYVVDRVDGITGKHSVDIKESSYFIYTNECGYYSIKDYGTYWALTREELEEEE